MTTVESVGGSFDFGRVVQRTFKMIGQNLGFFAAAALLLVCLPIFVGGASGWQTQMAGQSISWGVIVGSVVAAFGSMVLQTVVIHVVIARMNGREVSAPDALRTAASFILPLLGLGIVQGFAVVFGMLFFIIPGIILSVMWAVSTPSLIVEKVGVFGALQRSRDLTRGHRWSIVGLFMIYLVLSMILGAVVGVLGVAAGVGGAIVTAGSGNGHTPIYFVSTLISALVNGAQYVLVSAGVASLYYELRMTKEGVAPDQTASVFD